MKKIYIIVIIIIFVIIIIYKNIYKTNINMEMVEDKQIVVSHVPGAENVDYNIDGYLKKDNSIITTIITTCCRKNTLNSSIIKNTIESLKIIPEFSKKVIIVFDGGPIPIEKDIDEKCISECNNLLYEKYKKSVKEIAYEILGENNVIFVYLQNRSCLSHSLHTGMNIVKTKYVNIIQEDLPIIKKFDFNNAINIMEKYKDIKILRYSILTNAYHEEYAIKIGCKTLSQEIRFLDNKKDKFKISKSSEYSDQNHISTKEFYDKYVWPNVKKHSFMEHELVCINNNSLKDKIWYIGDYQDGDYIKSLDGRNS